jgi:arginyl-tRNA synthetase
MDTLPVVLADRLRAALSDFPDADPRVTAANDSRFGDYQSNVAMVLAKKARMNSRQLAEQIIGRLDVSDLCGGPEIAGAGFINFRLSPDAIASRFTELVQDARLGVPKPAVTRKLVVDFSSPNVAKPMHVGHIRSTILRRLTRRIAEFVGHTGRARQPHRRLGHTIRHAPRGVEGLA